MSARNIARILGAAVMTTWGLLSAVIGIPSASADPCPDVEVLFARGTNEPPGVGAVGQAFIDSLRSQVRARPVGVYAVNYTATDAFASSMPAGAGDARAHVENMAANCPNTRMVLGGNSEGATVIVLATDSMPPEPLRNTVRMSLNTTPEVAGASKASAFSIATPWLK